MDLAGEQKLKTFGNSADATIPCSNLCNCHKGARDKYLQMGKKHDAVFQEKANMLTIRLENIAKNKTQKSCIIDSRKFVTVKDSGVQKF